MAVHHEYAEHFLTLKGWTSTDYHRGEHDYSLPESCLRAFQTMIEEGTYPTPGVWAKEIHRSDNTDELKEAIKQHGELPSTMVWLKEKGIFKPPEIS